MSHCWFVTGTDTEVGKTAISCALLAKANSLGLRTAAIKPVAAGCDEQGHNEDALALQAVISEPLTYEQVNPIALGAAVAPHIAAAQEGRHLEVGALAGCCRQVMSGPADVTVIEGAGGWRVPLGPRATLADVAVELQVGVILVVAMRLGCINHALLSAEAIARDGVQLVGWVANQPGPIAMASYRENLATLTERLSAPLLGEVPYISPFCADTAAKYLTMPCSKGK